MPNGTSQFEAEYTRGAILGRGASGVAFIVRPKSNPQRQYVAKEICIVKSDEKRRKEAFAESQLLRTLSHANIIVCYDVIQDTDMMYIVMEYADGGDLAHWIQNRRAENRRLSEHTVMSVFVQICSALGYVHSRKILHRDLKPANIFLVGEGELSMCTVKLGDFGISKMIENTMAQANSTVGTPSYLSPEICKNHPYGMKADVWSLGVVLYELMCLRVPFHAGNLPAMALMICTSEPKPVPEEYGAPLADLVKSLLQKDPAKRPQVNGVLQLPYVQGFLPESQRGTGSDGPIACIGGTGGPTQAMPDVQQPHTRGASQPIRPSRASDNSSSRLPSCGPYTRPRTDKFPPVEDASSQWCWHRAGDPERPHAPPRPGDKGRAGPTPRAGPPVHGRRGERNERGGQRSDRGERADHVERLDRGERRDRGDHGERAEQTSDWLERPDRAERLDRSERLDRIKRADRGDRGADRSERFAKSDRLDRLERAERDHRGDRGNRGEDRSHRGDRGDRGSRGDHGGHGERAERGDCESEHGEQHFWAEQSEHNEVSPYNTLSSPPKGAWHSGDMHLESVIPTPEHNPFVRTDEELTIKLAGTCGSDSSSQVPPPEALQDPSPPMAEPPTSSTMRTVLLGGTTDSQMRMRRKDRGKRRPPLQGVFPHDFADSQDLKSPTRVPSSGSSWGAHTGSSWCAPQPPQPPHPSAPAEQPLLHPSAPLPTAASFAQLAARSVSPTRSAPSGPGGAAPEVPVPAALRASGSMPSLPPLPKQAPRPTQQRSRSVVALQDARELTKGYNEPFQPGQRGGPSFLRTAPLTVTADSVDKTGQSTLPPSLAPPAPQPPQPGHPPRGGQREESSGAVRAPKLPTTLTGQADTRHWREPPVGVGRIVEQSAVHEGWGDARDLDTRLPAPARDAEARPTARLSVV